MALTTTSLKRAIIDRDAEISRLRSENERLLALIQHPQLYTGDSVPVSAEWYGRILKEQTNQ